MVLADVTLPSAARGDAILTATGDQAAYIDASRWLSPADVLFAAAVRDAFADAPGRVRLLDPGAPGTPLSLRIEVSRFEADYAAGPGHRAAPTIRVDLVASLSRADGQDLVRKGVSVAVPAGADRVSAIVAAVSEATTSALDQVVAFADAEAPAVAASPNP